MCEELITGDDDAVPTGSYFHTECWLRAGLGDVAHLEEQCLCFGGSARDDQGTYREQSQRALAWVIRHHRGQWKVET